MVIITKGTFGWFDGRVTHLLTKASGPVSLDPGLERRLVYEDGIAQYVDGSEPIDAEVVETVIKTAAPQLAQGCPYTDPKEMDYKSSEFTFKDLGILLENMGVDAAVIKKLKSKASRISYIDKWIDEAEGDDQPPAFEAVDPE